jgi:hypothetical protein
MNSQGEHQVCRTRFSICPMHHHLQQARHNIKESGLLPEAELVRQALIDQGLETPLSANALNSDEKCKIISQHFTEIMAVTE